MQSYLVDDLGWCSSFFSWGLALYFFFPATCLDNSGNIYRNSRNSNDFRLGIGGMVTPTAWRAASSMVGNGSEMKKVSMELAVGLFLGQLVYPTFGT